VSSVDCTVNGVDIGNALTSDNCGVDTVYNDGLTTYPLGETTVMWTVEDDNGLSNNCSQKITVLDTIQPVLVCADTLKVNVDSGLCTASGVILSIPTITDNCTLVDTSNNELATYPLGITEVTWTAEDNSGNSNTCIQVVEVTDNIAPIITCPSDTILNCNEIISPNQLGFASTMDNCGIAITSFADSTYDQTCSSSYKIQRIWTTIDNSGLSSSCIQTINIIDTIPPVIDQVPDTLVYCDEIVYPVNPSFIDNCGTVTFARDSSIINDGCSGNYRIIYSFKAYDDCGNVDSVQSVLTVKDTLPPDFVNAPGSLDSIFSCASEVVLPSLPVSNDNCGSSDVILVSDDTFSFVCSNKFVRRLEWSTDDGCGNTSVFSAIITVNDTVGPTIQNAKNEVVSCNDDVNAEFTQWVNSHAGANSFDSNCGSSVTWSTIPSSPILNLNGSTCVTFVATDECGNSSMVFRCFDISCIEIEKKLVSYDDSDNNNQISLGDTLHYSIKALNNGTIPLTEILVKDSLLSTQSNTCSGPISPLDSCVLQGWYVINQNDVDAGEVINEGTAHSNESAPDSITLTTDIPQNPSISLVKNSELNLGYDGIANPGDSIVYSIIITNEGNVTLSDISILDTLFTGSNTWNDFVFDSSSLNSTPEMLLVNEKAYWSTVYVINQIDIDNGKIDNQAEVSSLDPKDNVIMDESDSGNSSDYNESGMVGFQNENDLTGTILPEDANIELIKSSDLSKTGTPVRAGDTLYYSFVISNTGNVTLDSIVISDPIIANNGLECSDTNLAPGKETLCSAWYILSQADVDGGLVQNSAVVTGNLPYGGTVVLDTSDTGNLDHPFDDSGKSDSTLTLIIPQPELELIKNIKTVIDNGDNETTVGDTIVYSFKIINTGNITLYDILIQDTLVTPVGGPLSSLAPGISDSTTFTAKYVVSVEDMLQGYVENSAIATGNPDLDNFFYAPSGPIGGLPPLISDVSDTGNPIETPNGNGQTDGDGNNDPVVIEICQPTISSCPLNWNKTVNFDSGSCAIESSYATVSDIISDDPSFMINSCGSNDNVEVSFSDELVPANCSGGGSAFFDQRVVNRTYVFSYVESAGTFGSCTQEITYNITSCVALSGFGVIGIDGDYNSSSNGSTFVASIECDVPPIVEESDVVGSCGYVEYMWLRSTQERSPGVPYTPNELIIGAEGSGAVWEIIDGAIEKDYDPSYLVTNTYYVRCARNFSCCNYGESNIVSYIISAAGTCPEPEIPSVSVDCPDEMTLASPTDDAENGDLLEYKTNEYIRASNIIRKGSEVTFNAKDSIVLLPGFEVNLNAQLTITTTGCDNN